VARITEIREKSQLPESAHAIYDAIAESRGGIVGPFPVMLNSPEVAARVSHLGHYLRFDSALSNVEREIAILTAARQADCDFEWAAHVRLAKQTGVRDETIDVIGRRAATSSLPADEALVVDFGRELLGDHRLSAQTFDAARKRWGDRGVVDLAALLGYYTMIACTLNGFEVLPAEGAAKLP
jgi:4-carboxymuconolactone decarboxylase